MNKSVKFILLTASLSLAMAFVFACKKEKEVKQGDQLETVNQITTQGQTWQIDYDRVTATLFEGALSFRGTGTIDGIAVAPENSEEYIAYPWDDQREDIVSATIEDGVTGIGWGAFARCRLSNVTIPNSVKSIAQRAFRNNQLTNVTIPSSVEVIGMWAFADNQITSVIFEGSETGLMITDKAFAGNPLNSITIGANVELDDNAFDDSFTHVYNRNNMQAGTYYKTNGKWVRK